MTIKKRVVVTGLGAVTPLGLSAASTWKSAIEGKSGIGRITQFDCEDFAVQIAGELKGYDVTAPVGPFHPGEGQEVTQAADRKEAKKMGRFIHLALSAGLEAYEDSGLDSQRDQIAANRIGINIGVGMGGLGEIEETHKVLLNKGPKRVTPFLIPQIIANMASGNLAILLNIRGPNLCNVTACSSSAHSIGESLRLIQNGEADMIFAGGSESVITPLGIAAFASMRALSTRNDDPETASRPYCTKRDGFVMGEGSAVLVLEELEHAKRRGAKIYGEILGYGRTGDAYHMTLPSVDGEGGFRAMELALKDSGISASQIDYVNAHGTSTPSGDIEEVKAIAALFPNGKDHLNVSSTKSMTGHTLGAAGAVEGFFALKAVQENLIPPTTGVEELDPYCVESGIDFTLDKPVEKEVNYALSNSFGFGGTNACLILGKAPQ